MKRVNNLLSCLFILSSFKIFKHSVKHLLQPVLKKQKVAQHLIELGHKDIAFVSGPLTSMSLSRKKRLEGVIQKLKENKLDKNLIIKAGTDEHEIYDSTYEIEVLLDKLSNHHNHQDQVCKIEYDPVLVVRESTGPVKK